MRAQNTLLFAALCLSALMCLSVVRAEEVVVLTENNFDELVESPNAGPWLVEFYAPWCGHCKSLEPVYNQVAAEAEGKITLGKVDCTAYPSLQKRFNVTGFPTIYFVREGEARMYRGDRTREAFLDYIGVVTGPPVDSLKSVNSALRNHPVVFVYAGSKDAAEYRVVESVARQLQGVVYFAETSSETIKSQLADKTSGPVLVRLSEGADPEVFPGPFEQPRLRKWVDARSLPLLTELTGSNFIDVVSQGQVVFCITDITKDSADGYQAACRDMAKQMKGKFIFAHLDGLKYDKYLSQFGLSPVNYPMIMVFDYSNEQYYIPQYSLTSGSQVREYLMSVYEGRVKPQTMGAWWSPVRIYRWFEKWIVQFSEIQVLIGSVVATGIAAALIWWTCCTGDSSGDDDEDVPAEEEKADGDESKNGGKKKGGRKPAKRGSAPAVEEDTSDTETSASASKKKDQ